MEADMVDTFHSSGGDFVEDAVDREDREKTEGEGMEIKLSPWRPLLFPI
jgi:hypothetical protein